MPFSQNPGIKNALEGKKCITEGKINKVKNWNLKKKVK